MLNLPILQLQGKNVWKRVACGVDVANKFIVTDILSCNGLMDLISRKR